MGDFKNAENYRHALHVRPLQMVTTELCYKCILRSFLIDECQITEFSSYEHTYPNATYGAQWIGHGGSVPCGQPDLPIYRTPITFYGDI
ncbi:hypothetical protein TNCV_2875101 [Trichonephila clavipes]|nr:hypothetical protein TNCV_2875101 [Trichonephila clavipes]